MKSKIYTLVALALSTSIVSAQNLPTLHHSGPDHVATAPATADILPPSSPYAVGDTIWYDDFADTGDWIMGTTGAAGTADSLWEHTLDGPYGTFSGSWGDVDSETAGNGWVMFDSDGNGSADPGTGAPTGVEFDTYIQMANPVDLSSYPVVAVVFQEFYKALQSQIWVDVSIDGTNWTSTEYHADFGGNDQTAQPEYAYQDISAVAGGQATVWVRLRYEGFGYFWQVDDFAFVEGISNDLRMARVFTGNNNSDYLYTKMPISQAVDMELGAVVSNIGGLAQTNLMLDWDISDGSGSVASGTESMTASLASGANDTLFFSTGFSPSNIGDHTITMTVSADSVDANTGNDMDSEVVEITDHNWAHDFEDENYSNLGYDETEEPLGFEIGATYLCRADGQSIYAVDVPLSTATSASSVTINIYEDGTGSGFDVASQIYDIQNGDLSSTGNPQFINIVLDDPVQMNLGSEYIATVAFEAGDEGQMLGNFIDDGDNGQVFYSAQDDTWYNWIGLSTGIRLNLNPSVGIADEPELMNVSVLPNPATDVITVELSLETTSDLAVSITALDGKTVISESFGTVSGSFRTTLDVSELSQGAYTVQLISENTVHTEKLIIAD